MSQTPKDEGGFGSEPKVPSPKTRNADTDTGHNKLRTAEEQGNRDLSKLGNE